MPHKCWCCTAVTEILREQLWHRWLINVGDHGLGSTGRKQSKVNAIRQRKERVSHKGSKDPIVSSIKEIFHNSLLLSCSSVLTNIFWLVSYFVGSDILLSTWQKWMEAKIRAKVLHIKVIAHFFTVRQHLNFGFHNSCWRCDLTNKKIHFSSEWWVEQYIPDFFKREVRLNMASAPRLQERQYRNVWSEKKDYLIQEKPLKWENKQKNPPNPITNQTAKQNRTTARGKQKYFLLTSNEHSFFLW